MQKTTLPKISKGITSALLVYAGIKGTNHSAELQELALDGKRNYDWMQGHFGDFCFPMAWSAISHYVHKDKWMQRIFAYLPPTIGTINEIYDGLIGTSNYVDWADITFYWLGAAAGRLGPNIASKVTESLQEAIFPDQFRNNYIKYKR